MTQLESTKMVNSLKLKFIKKGGYEKFKKQLKLVCELHHKEFGVDLYPKHLK